MQISDNRYEINKFIRDICSPTIDMPSVDLSILPCKISYLPISNEVKYIKLPEWAKDLGIGALPCLLIPAHCCCESDSLDWKSVDWFRAAFDMATCQAEYKHELQNTSIHSYAVKLPMKNSEQWDYAWVNRIVLFLKRWVAYEKSKTEEEIFGNKTTGKIYLTHDVDYVSKTLALRIKQSAFLIFNIIKLLINGNLKTAYKKIYKLFIFFFSSGDYWQFLNIVKMETEYGLTSTWNFYGGKGGFKRSFTELLFDPAYRVQDKKLSNQIRELKSEGHTIGLHQGFYSWKNADRMLVEKNRVENSLGEIIYTCRQHWLRFSFKDTWKAQEAAGFHLDTTLGFNERAGFRNSAALRLPAWIAFEQRFSDTLETLPMVLMDSHLFDYGQMNPNDRKKIIDNILDEIAFVGGEATVIWHQRVFHSDYNWGEDYRYLLEGIKSRGLH